MPYKVLHLGVGLYRQNDIVTEDQLHAHGGESGIDMDRLFNLGAIEETDEEPTVPNMENPENQIFRTSTGDTVDYPGSDRPTVAAIAREKSTKVLSPKDRVKLFARKGKAEGDGTPGGPTEGPVGATRSTAAMREQREKGLVPEFRESEIADYEEVRNTVRITRKRTVPSSKRTNRCPSRTRSRPKMPAPGKRPSWKRKSPQHRRLSPPARFLPRKPQPGGSSLLCVPRGRVWSALPAF
jgi:hypothetical protein